MVCQERSNRIVKWFSAYSEHPNAESLFGEENTLLFRLNSSMKGKMFHLSVETQSGRASQRLASGWQGHRFARNPNERSLSLYVLSASSAPRAYLFIFGCVESSLLKGLFSRCSYWGYSVLQCTGFSLRWLLSLQSAGSRLCGLQAAACGLSSCSPWALERRLNSCGTHA